MITPFGYVYYTALSRYAGEEKKKKPFSANSDVQLNTWETKFHNKLSYQSRPVLYTMEISYSGGLRDGLPCSPAEKDLLSQLLGL